MVPFILIVILQFVSLCRSKTLITAGPKFKVYDPDKESLFYVNDHTFILGTNWNIMGISHTNPADPSDEINLAHAMTNTTLLYDDKNGDNTQIFKQQPAVLGAKYPETHLWAPHILDVTQYGYTCNNEINNGNNKHCYIMVYCGGGVNRSVSYINSAYSTDLYEWKRLGTYFADGVDARDPMLMFDEYTKLWHLYYTGTRPNDETIGNVSHVVLLRQSNNLFDINSWNKTAKIVFNCGYTGNNYGGPCESPFVIRRGQNNYYLFTGAWYNYTTTRSFYSNNSLYFGDIDSIYSEVGIFGDMHAAEVIRDTNGKWYISGCGWSEGGVYLREITFYDNLDNESTSMNIPIPIQIPNKLTFDTNLDFVYYNRHNNDNNYVIYNESVYWNILPSFSSNIFAGNLMNNSFLMTDNFTLNLNNSQTEWGCNIIFKLITSDGNPTTNDPILKRDGSAACIVFGVDNNTNNKYIIDSAYGINLFLNNHLMSGGGIEFFKFEPYKQYQLVNNNNIANDIWYNLSFRILQNKYLDVYLNDTIMINNYQIPFQLLTGYFGLNVWQSSVIFKQFRCD